MKNGIRKEREFDRLLLKNANAQFLKEYGKGHFKSRGIIDQIKIALVLAGPDNYPCCKFRDQVLKRQAAQKFRAGLLTTSKAK